MELLENLVCSLSTGPSGETSISHKEEQMLYLDTVGQRDQKKIQDLYLPHSDWKKSDASMTFCFYSFSSEALLERARIVS